MDTTHPDFDLAEYSTIALACLLRGAVAARQDLGFMLRERVDVAGMTEQADWLYAELMHRGLAAAQIAVLVPGVEVFA